jgi:hypothetical protein
MMKPRLTGLIGKELSESVFADFPEERGSVCLTGE